MRCGGSILSYCPRNPHGKAGNEERRRRRRTSVNCFILFHYGFTVTFLNKNFLNVLLPANFKPPLTTQKIALNFILSKIGCHVTFVILLTLNQLFKPSVVKVTKTLNIECLYDLRFWECGWKVCLPLSIYKTRQINSSCAVT